MTDKKLPPYFKEYLDEKFSHVVEQIKEVKKEVEKTNGQVAKHQRNISWNSYRIRIIMIVLLFATALLFPRLSELFLGTVTGFF